MCNCIELVNESLGSQGYKLDIPILLVRDTNNIQLSASKVRVGTLKVKTNKPGPALIPSYCPFCGEKYLEATK
jgi:hypothetical protein